MAAKIVEMFLAGIQEAGSPLASGTVTHYEPGVVTPSVDKVYTDKDKTTPAANPFTLDSNGRATIYVDGMVKWLIKRADGTTFDTPDNCLYFDNLSLADDTGSASNVFLVASATGLTHAPRASQVQNSTMQYAADGGATDAYAITLAPAPSAYASGQVFHFKANTANTTACTLNVNSLGAKTIKKHKDQDLATGDIEAGQIITVAYDGTNFQMQSQLAWAPEQSFKGYIQGFDMAYASASTITISGGSVEIDGQVYYTPNAITPMLVGPAASTWYYVLVDTSSASYHLLPVANWHEFSTTAPTYDHAKSGWYDAGGTKRCIGAFKTDGSSNIIAFYKVGRKFFYDSPQGALTTATPATSLTAFPSAADMAPALGRLVVKMIASYNHATSYLFGCNGDSTVPLQWMVNYGTTRSGICLLQNTAEFLTNTSQQIKYYAATGSIQTDIWIASFEFPGGF